jgi:hypothetical protein
MVDSASNRKEYLESSCGKGKARPVITAENFATICEPIF